MPIVLAQNRGDIKRFVHLPFVLRGREPNWVPPLLRDELETFAPRRNPAYEYAEARLWLALEKGRVVGRLAGILNHAANRKDQTRNLRFGWLETVEDYAVARDLLAAAEDWARQEGMTTLTGPHGFCDLDPQGLLVEGFEHLPTAATIYNPPYYVDFLVKYGMVPEVDYLELLLTDRDQVTLPQRVRDMARLAAQRYGLRLMQPSSRSMAREWAPRMFEVLNQSFQPVYGSVPLTQRQIEYYVKKYIGFLDLNLALGVVDASERMVGFVIAMPSLSRALQAARGRLLPLGWLHLWRGLRQRRTVDFYLVGVLPSHQGRGAVAMLMERLFDNLMAQGYERAESNPILEGNQLSLALLRFFNPRVIRRRRIFKKAVPGTAAQGQGGQVQ